MQAGLKRPRAFLYINITMFPFCAPHMWLTLTNRSAYQAFPRKEMWEKGEKSLALKKPLRSVFLIGCFTQSLLWLDRLSLVWGTAFSVSGLSASPSLVELVCAVRNLYFSFSWQLAWPVTVHVSGTGGLKGHMSCGSLAYIAPPSPCHVTMIGN